MRQQERINDVSHMGPGSYIGNALTFGKETAGPTTKILPENAPGWVRPLEHSPSPDKYDAKRGFDLIGPKVTDVKFIKATS